MTERLRILIDISNSYPRAFPPIFRHLFVSRNFSIFQIFQFFFSNIGMLTNLMFLLLLENFANSDRTPPYIDTYLQLLFPNFGNYGHKPSPIRINKPKTPHTLPSLAQYTSHPTTHLGVGPWVQFSTPFSTILEPTRPTALDRPELHFPSCALLYIPGSNRWSKCCPKFGSKHGPKCRSRGVLR